MKALLLTALLLAGCTQAPKTDLSIVTHTETATVTVTKQPTPQAAALSRDGTYLIGQDIQPGTYHTAGPADPSNECYWVRMNATTGTVDAVIAQNFSQGQQVVTIEPTDVAFETKNCQPWSRSP